MLKVILDLKETKVVPVLLGLLVHRVTKVVKVLKVILGLKETKVERAKKVKLV